MAIIDAALVGVKDPKISVFVDMSEFRGWELRVAWDDCKLGLKYGNEFDKIAIFAHQKWIEYGIKISRWFMSGEIKQFENKDEALRWLKS